MQIDWGGYDMPIQDNLEEETLAIKNGVYEENW